MTKIKTAQAWGYVKNDELLAEAGAYGNNPVVIVHGQTEAEVHEASALRSACREFGIETVEQLKTRLAPDKDYPFLLSIIHWAIAFWDAVPNDTLMYYTPPLPKGIDLDYLRDLVKGVKYPPKLADDSPVAPDPRVAVLEAELQAERVINQTISECQGAGGNECQCNVCILTRTIKTLGKENCDLHDKLIAAQRGRWRDEAILRRKY